MYINSKNIFSILYSGVLSRWSEKVKAGEWYKILIRETEIKHFYGQLCNLVWRI